MSFFLMVENDSSKVRRKNSNHAGQIFQSNSAHPVFWLPHLNITSNLYVVHLSNFIFVSTFYIIYDYIYIYKCMYIQWKKTYAPQFNSINLKPKKTFQNQLQPPLQKPNLRPFPLPRRWHCLGAAAFEPSGRRHLEWVDGLCGVPWDGTSDEWKKAATLVA